jgi:hypothetical protein
MHGGYIKIVVHNDWPLAKLQNIIFFQEFPVAKEVLVPVLLVWVPIIENLLWPFFVSMDWKKISQIRFPGPWEVRITASRPVGIPMVLI